MVIVSHAHMEPRSNHLPFCGTEQSDSAGVVRTATMPVSGEWQLMEQRPASKSYLGPKPQLGTRGRLRAEGAWAASQ